MATPATIDKHLEWTIEILANLIFLTKHHSGDPEKVHEYMLVAEQQLLKLNDLVHSNSDESNETEV